MSGIELIAAERERQVQSEGWTSEHDDNHVEAELGYASAVYLITAVNQVVKPNDPVSLSPAYWPWDLSWWKPDIDPVRNLVKAGALIAAEIDRLQRKRASQQ